MARDLQKPFRARFLPKTTRKKHSHAYKTKKTSENNFFINVSHSILNERGVEHCLAGTVEKKIELL